MSEPIFEIQECLGCGCEVEAVSTAKRGDAAVGYNCSCGALVIDAELLGFLPNWDPRSGTRR